jgi:hypothetical protein
MAEVGTIETIALELGQALKPLSTLLTPDFFEKLGVPLPQSLKNNAAITGKITEAQSLVAGLPAQITDLQSAISASDTIQIIEKGGVLVGNIKNLMIKLKELGTAVNTAAGNVPGDLKDLADRLPVRILEYCLVGYLAEHLPLLTRALNLIGAIDKEVPLPAGMVLNNPLPAIVPRRFYLDRIPKILSDPPKYLQDTFKLGLPSPAFNGKELLTKIQGLLIGLGYPAELSLTNPLVLESEFFKAEADLTANPPGLKFEAHINGDKTFDKDYTISSLWKGKIHNHRNFAAGLKAKLQYPLKLTLQPNGAATVETLLSLKAQKNNNEPIMLLGITGGTRLQAKSISASIGINALNAGSGADVVPALQIAIAEGKLVIDFLQADGFIKSLLGNVNTEAKFDLSASWDPDKGLRLQGSGGVDIMIPLHIDLFVVSIEGVYFNLGFSSSAGLTVGLSAIIKTNLGPLVAVVDGIGTNFPITFPENGDGNLGLANLGANFSPPTRIGLSIDTGVIKGGGFLGINVAKGEYVGALELSFQGFIDLKAIGIISTKMPDGGEGFALLILITAEFTPMQLGFGFTLIGVGGLLGVNRKPYVAAIQEGVKTGAISSVLFPQDIVNNITRIISDLQQIFPISKGVFVIAPMAKIGWGTPTLISLEMGIIIDVPLTEIVILGVLRCVLPTEDAAILKLQVNFAGGINFSKGLWFNASLFDSRLLAFTLTGDMALRIGWGDNPMFVLSVGGFHPSFNEVPADLKGMKRITISLLSGKNPRISVATYFAVTSNTVQSGARVELYAAACGFNVFGYLGYDLLVQFNPFYFIAQIEAGIALRRGNSEIAGIHLAGQLSGPTPWHALGKASLKILFVKVSVKFDVTWGDQAPAQPEELENVLLLVEAALLDDRNWMASLPPNTNTNVSLRKLELTDGKIVIHPFTILSVSQKVVPLEMDINKFGHKKPAPDTRFTLKNEDNSSPQYVKEEFAIGNFVSLKDDEKLSRKSFDQMKSGLTFQTTNVLMHGVEIQKEVDYEMSYVHRKKLTLRIRNYKFWDKAFAIFAKGNAISKNVYSISNKLATNAPAKVEVGRGNYSIVNIKNLEPHGAMQSLSSEAEAYVLHGELLRKNPELKDQLQVVSQFELN